VYVNSDKGVIDVDDSVYEECKPAHIIKDLGMLSINYEEQAKFGHFKD
jgi:S-adenosylmethionine synthetase